MQKRKHLILFIIALLTIPANCFSQYLTEDIFKFSRAMGYISNFYVDTVNSPKLVENAIINVLKELDPHSVYIPEDEVKEMNEPLEGNFEGIGIQFNLLNDTIYVISPISGGPSEKVGLRAGDRIVKINEEIVAGKGISNTGVRDRLLGEKGTKVIVWIKRKGVKELLSFTITRDKIPIFSVDAAYLIDKDIAYIKINRFALTTVDEFVEKIKKLKAQGSKSLILDLRDNGGGYLDKAIELADHFLDDNKLIVFTEGLRVPRTESFATNDGICQDGNVIILIDEGSASASEIVAGAVQDWDRGIIIGRRSFGKGLVQKPFYLPDGSMIRLTIARYHTPTGRVIQKPYDKGMDNYEKELLTRYQQGEMMNKDSINFHDSLKYFTLQNKRIVYGGGGIMPDIFVPLDTTSVTEFYSKMVRQGVLNSFVLDYIDKNRKSLKSKYPDFNTYNEKFVVTPKMIEELVIYGANNKIEPKGDDAKKSEYDFSLIIKALIARDLWDMSEYYQIVNVRDKGFNKAVEVAKNWEKYHSEVLINQ
ncbi:MAG: peptidase S41 [Bacteroidetes bacterium GWC2_33_15]|nr:MAG: peptidase S41 [Bacteroidetes bacterium GWA2_33_15]OFX48778.1 MAG: peptidase S41 [Bacteroidetes bacterium GWC2_33_15]OFX66020.1 MAG: peptidase S41 [Bacteroidetes bacterium GWB2_32_14]OFX68219.1 MAG: peptidase S41 [Bacteroidetes bacterium GWD2_33_33]HAN17995.1 peptidase S41 [Bacteroidales bacterium]